VNGLRRHPPLDPARVRLGTMCAQVSSVGRGHDVTGDANDNPLRYRFAGAPDDASDLARSAASDCLAAGIRSARMKETDA
jgi:hypothetical protein